MDPSALQSKSPDFAVRAFEFHSNDRLQTGMWRWQSLDQALDLMERLEMNTLIFHQNTLTDWAVLPRAYFTPEAMRARWPARLANVANGRNHLREVVRRAKQRGIRFFLEVKEMSFPEELLELHPEVMELQGVPCPTHPFWWEYERAKYRELVADLPDIGGVLVSPGTRESKLSLSVHNCTCARCRSYNPADWYTNIIRSMYEPLAAQGKLLVVRDFAYSKSEQNLIVDACSTVSKDIGVALKNTPHDFYPTFPDNPRIGHSDGHPQWIEFDTWGQYFGMGFFPASVVEDMQRRLRYAKQNGAVGAMFRTDLEFISESNVFNSLSLVNLFGGGMLSRAVEQDLDGVYDAWLRYGICDHLKGVSEQSDPVPVQPADRARFRDFVKACWSVLEKSVYVRKFVFNDGTCQFPFSVDHAYFSMLVFQGLDDWEPGASKRLDPTAENLRIVLEEKEQAVREAGRLPDILRIDQAQLPAELKASYATLLELYELYVRGFRDCAAVCFRTRRALTTYAQADVNAGKQAVDDLAAYRGEVERRLRGTLYPHYVYWFFDLQYLDQLILDARAKLAAIP